MIFSGFSARTALLLKCSLGLVALGAVGLCAPTAQAIVYSIDDGSAERSIGFKPVGNGSGNADAIFLNEFTALPNDKTINSISIAFGNPGNMGGNLDGLLVTILLYSEPNGDTNPSDAQLLALSPGLISQANTNTFVTYAITPTTIPTTDFFVGFEIQDLQSGTFVAAEDTSAPTYSNRSFIAFGDPGTGNPINLAANQVPPTAVENLNGLAGNFLIRANTAVPEPSTWATLLGGMAMLAGVQRFRRVRVA